MNVFDLQATLTLDTSQYQSSLSHAEGMAKSAAGSGGGFTVLKGVMSNLVSGGINMVAGALTNNLGAAFKRVDTLNNYSTVMSNLGKDSKDAKEEVNRLSEGIDGLPTALDQIVSSQQQFAALGGSLSEATDLTIALNNATLAGGKGQVVANSAMQQWYQMIAAGKSDMMSMRIINEAMPAQMDAIAKKVVGEKATWQDLHEEWKKNPDLTKKVKDAIIDLNENGYKVGSKEAKAFKDQAIDANKGIETSMQNVQTSITKGIANFLNEGIGQEAIADMFNGIKETVNNIFGSKDENGDWTGLIGSIKRIKEAFSEGGFGEAIKTAFDDIIGGINGAIGKARDAVGQAFLKLMNVDWQNIFTTVLNGLGDMFKNLFTVALNFEALKTDIQSSLISIAGEAIIGFIETIINNGDKIAASAVDLITNFLVGLRENTIRLANAAFRMVNKLADYIINNSDRIGKAAVKIVISLARSLIKNVPRIISGAFRLAGAIITGFVKIIPKIPVAVVKIITSIVKALWDKRGELLNVGKDIVKGIWSGISNGWKWITGKIKEWCGSIIDYFKKILDIGSPSKVFAAEVGKWIPLGIAKGIEDNVGAVSDAVDDAVDIPDMAGDVVESGSLEGGLKMVSFAPNITVDGAENPEEYAMRLMREMKMEARMA